MADPNITKIQEVSERTDGERVLGGQLFEILVTLDNHTRKPWALPNAHIIEMVIEEDLLHWPYKGYIIYSNPNEFAERNLDPDAWFYRMDARDEVNIKVKLKDESYKNIYPPEIWEMDLDFVVYDTEDLPTENVTNKIKKMYFWDKRYQLMSEKKIFWSTATANGAENPAYAGDDERSMMIGDAIEHLLTKEAGYEDSIDEEYWDRGFNGTFYTSPMESSLVDDLNSLLSSHISETEDDIALFKYNNRYEKKWQLVPIHKFFDNAGDDPETPGKWQIEHMFFEDIESMDPDTTPFRAPYRDDMDFEAPFMDGIDIKIGEYNRIRNYEFVDMAGADNSKALVSKPVYSYSLRSGTFRMDYEQNEIEHAKEKFKEMYTDKLLPAESADPIFTLNKIKKDQLNVEPEFTFTRSGSNDKPKHRLTEGLGKLLFSGLMLNEFIKFRVLGSPHRTIGRFVGIDRMTSHSNYDFDNKICGQWFVTNVKHIWNHNRYVNDICAVKVHMKSGYDIEEDV